MNSEHGITTHGRPNVSKAKGDRSVHKLHRRRGNRAAAVSFTLIGAAAALLSACGSSTGTSASATTSSTAPTATSTVLLQVYPGTIVNLVTYVAQQEGFFAKNGIKAVLVPINSSPAGAAALAGGSINILSASPDAILPFVQKGLPVEVFAGQTKQIFELIVNNSVQSSAPYPQSIKALAGKKIGVTALGSAGQALMEAMLGNAGLSPSAVTFVAVGGPATGLAAVENGLVSADLLYDPTPTAAVLSGKAHILVDLRKGEGPPSIANTDYVGEWATKSYIAGHPKVISGLRRAFAEADVWMHESANLSAVEQIYSSVVGVAVPQNDLAAFTKANLPIATAAYSATSLNAWNQFDTKYHFLTQPLSLSNIYSAGTPASEAAVRSLAGS